MNTPRQESSLHDMMCTTDAEIRCELLEQGLNPDDEAQLLRKMIESMIRKDPRSEPELMLVRLIKLANGTELPK